MSLNGTFGTHFGHIEKGFVLGLDLQGGTHLEYEADVSKVATADRQAALDGVKDVVERRVNTIGVSEPLITTAQAGDSCASMSIWQASVTSTRRSTSSVQRHPAIRGPEYPYDATDADP